MEMQDFDDLVRPYSAQHVLAYYRWAQLQDWPRPEERLALDEKDGLWKLHRPQSMNTKFKRFFTDYAKNPAKDLFHMWEDNWVEEQPMIEAQCGPWPGIDIAHVPFEEHLFYACRDSDACLRLAGVLSRMRRQVRSQPQERWRDAA